MNSQLSIIQNEIKNQNYYHAETLCWAELKKNSQDYGIKKCLAISLMLQNKIYGAIESYESLFEKNNQDFDVINNLCHLYIIIEDFEKADEFNQISFQLNPDLYYCHLNQGDLFFRKREYLKSKESLERAMELLADINKYAQVLHLVQLYGDVLIALGKNKEAISFVDNCFKINKDPTLFYYIMNLNSELYEKNFVDSFVNQKLNTNFKSDSQRFQMLAPMYFGLARYSENFDTALSEACYLKANELSSLVQRFRPLDHQKDIIAIKSLYKKYLIDSEKVDPNTGKDFVFIIGMPRSGTTLIESIISTSEDVFSGGEMTSMAEILKKHYETKNKVDENYPSLADIADTYISRMNFLKGNKKIFIDKLPGNFYHLGIILLAMPRAKIIHIKRDPWDIAISLFKQLYISNIPFASKFFNIACTIANYEHLMAFWHQNVDSKKILEIQYEDLVKNEYDYAKSLFEFLGINKPYDSSKRTSFFSRTASKLQIKGEIHVKSLKKTDFSDYKDAFLRDYEAQKRYWELQN